MRRPTIRDVAQKAGYSVATVSLVMNNKPVSIPQSTREKIWAAAKALNYRPNQLAVGMITKRTRVIGLIIPDNANLFFADLSKAIETRARRAGYSLIYGNSNNDAVRDVEYIRMFADRQVDGIILAQSTPAGERGDLRMLRAMEECSIPFVTADRRVHGSDSYSVLADHFKGGYLATQHLLELGHRRIGCYTGPLSLFSSLERLAGYRAALEEAGVAFDEALVFTGDYQMGKEGRALTHFLNCKVSAIFAFNDLMAYGLYREMRKRGLSIPQDVSLVGFDNIPFSDLVEPALTTVAQPVEAIGRCAVEVLLGMMDSAEAEGAVKPENRIVLFEPQLLVRESTAPYAPQKKDAKLLYGEKR